MFWLIKKYNNFSLSICFEIHDDASCIVEFFFLNHTHRIKKEENILNAKLSDVYKNGMKI